MENWKLEKSITYWPISPSEVRAKQYKTDTLYSTSVTTGRCRPHEVYGETEAQAIQRGKLAAAAPDMLEALQGLIDPLTGLVEDRVAQNIGSENSYAIEQAIEKALK